MADRRVTHAHRDAAGDILAVCWAGSGGLMYSTRADVIADIESGTNRYFVEEEAPSVYVLVKSQNGVKYITTEADETSKNNLDNLRECNKK